MADINTRRSQGADGGLTAGAGTADTHFHAAHSVIARHAGGIRRGLLRREGSALARSAETERTRTLPGEYVARRVSDGHDRIIEGRLNVSHAMGNVLALFLLERLLLAFFLGGCAARCCWFCHKTSVSKFQSFKVSKFDSETLKH